MIEREPSTWRGQRVSLFGIVKQRKEAPGGMAYLTLSVRTLATRNLCDQMDEDTCRVTVSDHEFAVVHAMAKLRPEDSIGKDSLATGSLVRVIAPSPTTSTRPTGWRCCKRTTIGTGRALLRHDGRSRPHEALTRGPPFYPPPCPRARARRAR